MGSDQAVGRLAVWKQRLPLWRSLNFNIEQVGLPRAASNEPVWPMEDDMPTFVLTINWTDQRIRAVRDAPKRSQAARELAKKVGVEIKQIYLTCVYRKPKPWRSDDEVRQVSGMN
jgi:hypothetical protein